MGRGTQVGICSFAAAALLGAILGAAGCELSSQGECASCVDATMAVETGTGGDSGPSGADGSSQGDAAFDWMVTDSTPEASAEATTTETGVAADTAPPKCMFAANCPAGQACNQTTGECGPTCQANYPSLCNGCCDSQSMCRPGTTAAICGASGAMCAACAAPMKCAAVNGGGACSASCTGSGTCGAISGCCTSSLCVPPTQDTACGLSACTDCSSLGEVCDTYGDPTGAVAACTTCSPVTGLLCPTGQCCQGGTCVGTCAAASPMCIEGSCVQCRSSQDCPVGHACENSSCTTSCDSNHGCHGGCCLPPETLGSATCVAGDAGTACGSDGGFCSLCAVNDVCAAGSCQCASNCPTGATCSGNAVCCSGNCMGGSCQESMCQTMHTCPSGNLCCQSSDCLSRNCVAGKCGSPACSPGCPVGSYCDTASDCCSSSCMGGTCEASGCQATNSCAVGSGCCQDSDCCSGTCSGRVCEEAFCEMTGQCQAGDPCCQNTDCLSQQCGPNHTCF